MNPVNWFMGAARIYFPHMSHLKVPLGLGKDRASPTNVVILCLVALITLELCPFNVIIGSFGSLVASSAALIALTDFSVF